MKATKKSMNQVSKVIPITTFLLFSLMCTLTIYIFEVKGRDFQLINLDLFLQNKVVPTKTFSFKERNSFVPDLDLYHPFPRDYFLTQTPLSLQKAVYRYSQTCKSADYSIADNTAKLLTLSPSKLLIWHRAICTKDWRPFLHWLTRKPFMHPTGTSYAKLYMDHHHIKDNKYSHLLHYLEKKEKSRFDDFYENLDPNERFSYYLGNKYILNRQYFIYSQPWTGQERKINVYNINALNDSLVAAFGLKINSIQQASSCLLVERNICIEQIVPVFSIKPWWFTVILSYLVVYLLFLFILYLYFQHKKELQQNQDQALLFQLISHEVKTPMTSLKLNLNALREVYNDLPSRQQKSLMSSLENYSSVERVINHALLEIKSDHKGSNESIFRIYDAIDAQIYGKYDESVQFDYEENDTKIRMSRFWFDTILANLIKNAINHGKPPIKIYVDCYRQHIDLTVEDQGQVALKELIHMSKMENKNPQSKGLGIGLSIIKRKAKELNMDIIIKANPTRYTVRFKTSER